MDASTKTNSPALPPDEDLTEVRKPASLLIAQFFLFPLIIIGICVGIFLLFGYMMFLLLAMAALPIKMILRWLFNLKYIVGIPEYFFNI